MQLEDVLLKYTRIFNLFGESCVLSSDFRLSTRSVKDRVIAYFSICCSLFLTITSLTSMLVLDFLYSIIISKTGKITYTIFVLSLISTKLTSISQMHSLTRLLPMGFNHFKEINSLAQSKYDIDFYRFQKRFYRGVMKIFGVWLISLISSILLAESGIQAAMSCSEALALFLNRITICHIYFYFNLFQTLYSIFIDHVKRTASINQPKNSSDLKSELLFIKTNHFKLYEISNILGAAFGWTLVMIFIEEFIDFTTAISWILSNMDCAHIYSDSRNHYNN